METERLLEVTVEKEFEGCTVLAVAHQLHTIHGFDGFIKISNGVAIEVSRNLVRAGATSQAQTS